MSVVEGAGEVLPRWLSGKESACQCRKHGFDLWVRKIPVGGNGNPLQYPCLENSMDRGAWNTIVHGVAKSQTQLNNNNVHTHTHTHTPNDIIKDVK